MNYRTPAATTWLLAILTAIAGAQGADGRLARALFASTDAKASVSALDGTITADERQRLLAALDDVAREREREGPPAVAGDGVAAGPLADAAWAEGYLKARRDSPLAPFLYTFLMARLRHAFELQAQANDVAGQTATAKKYRAFLQRARAVQDRLIVRIAEDLDGLPYLVRETAFHPRDFNPDT